MDSACDMLPPSSPRPALHVVPAFGCHKSVKTTFLSSKQSIKGHPKDKLQESKLTDVAHLHCQITNLISSYSKK